MSPASSEDAGSTSREQPARLMRVAILVKQVPVFDEMALGPDGRLERGGDAEMNPYCRRAVTAGVSLARAHGARSTVLSLGPPRAEAVLREALACGVDDAVLVCDPVFAGSDTLATAHALAAALRVLGPFDMVLAGLSSVDADTGQVPPQLAELLGLPFLAGVRRLELTGALVRVRLERDAGWAEAEVQLPVLLSCAERLCRPCKADEVARAAVDDTPVRRLGPAELGPGPWGEPRSRTSVGQVKVLSVERQRLLLSGPLAGQVRRAVAAMAARGALDGLRGLDGSAGAPAGVAALAPVVAGRGELAVAPGAGSTPEAGGEDRSHVGAGRLFVLAEPGRSRLTGELLRAADDIATQVGAEVVLVSAGGLRDADDVADQFLLLEGVEQAEDVARELVRWCATGSTWALFAPATTWGREVAARAAASLDAGLTADVIGLELLEGRLVGWKPAFGGQAVVAVTATSGIQMVTVRPGTFVPSPVRRVAPRLTTIGGAPTGRIRITASGTDDGLDALAAAEVVVGVGCGVEVQDHGELEALLAVLGAQLAATRKVTDRGWLPRSRQVGVTGQSLDARLYVAVGLSGKFNHMVGTRRVRTVVAVNSDPGAPVFQFADVGIVGDWRQVVPVLVEELGRLLPDGRAGSPS